MEATNLYILKCCGENFTDYVELSSNNSCVKSESFGVNGFSLSFNVLSLVIGIVGLLANVTILFVCANKIMWERAMSRFMIPIAIFDILFIVLTKVVIVIPAIVQFFGFESFGCRAVVYAFGPMGLANMEASYLIVTLVWERLCIVIDPFERAGCSLLEKTRYSGNLAMITFWIILFLSLPRFAGMEIQWISFAYLFLDTILPICILLILGTCMWIKYHEGQEKVNELFPNRPIKKSRIGTYIALTAITVISLAFSLGSFFSFWTDACFNYGSTSESAIVFYHFNILIQIVIASVKIGPYLYWGIYFNKAFNIVFNFIKV